GLLKPFGAMVLVGLPPEGLEISARNLIAGDKALAGSNIGGIAQTQEMLDFCAEHGIGARIEKIGVHDVDVAYDRVVAGDVRSRFVIDTAGFEDAPLEA
ncbi:MAG: alcohol dehydrogenase, partial [Cutibacterium granulosum]|nr:alcohol dehydrogenase [Cutibacterium granulosum]